MPTTKIYGYHKAVGTVSVIIATSVTVSSAGGWGQTTGSEGDGTDGIIDLTNYGWGGIATPSTFDGTVINFSAATTRGGTYYTCYDELNTALLITTSASRFTPFPARLFAMGPFIKIVTATNQATTDTVFPFILTA